MYFAIHAAALQNAPLTHGHSPVMPKPHADTAVEDVRGCAAACRGGSMRGRYRSGFVGSGSLRIWNREKANEVGDAGDGFPERAETEQRGRAHARTLLTRTNAHTDATQARARAATTAGWNTRPPYNIATHKMQRTRCNAQHVRWRTRKGRDRPPRLAEHGL